ncbi:MAG: hypothetical protein E6H80_12850 [Betaproteobacteria bacterium]|nr:MAG: hypothetical protein E6H80_12850 [Betaproteobacteria bacterium]
MPDVRVDRLFGQDRAFYDTVSDLGFNVPLPWSQGPRRMGTDKNADLLWVGNSFGSSWAKINTKTLETTIIPLPDPAMQAYHIAVDSKHHVWGNLWTADRIVRLDPGTNTWTIFDLPVRGTEIRHIALLERDGKLFVVVPDYRTSQMCVMTVRSEAETVKPARRKKRNPSEEGLVPACEGLTGRFVRPARPSRQFATKQ